MRGEDVRKRRGREKSEKSDGRKHHDEKTRLAENSKRQKKKGKNERSEGWDGVLISVGTFSYGNLWALAIP